MTPLPPYPGATKPLSVNYTAGGDPFAIADDVEDDLDPRDLYHLARAVEDHQHGTGRGLPINRIGTATAPQNPGDIQVQGDDFRWWADTTDAIFSAVNTNANQTVNGVKRLNQPVLLPRQSTAPVAPGAGLAYMYLGPGDRLYLCAGDNPPSPVGTPILLGAALNWNTQQGAGQTQLQQLFFGAPTWVQSFRPASNDYCTLSSVAPLTYAATPITFYVTWTCGVGTGKVNWELTAGVVSVNGDLLAPANSVVTQTVDAPDANYRHNRTALTWATGLPSGGDVVYYALKRNDTTEAAAGAKYATSVHMLNVSVLYG